jgi:uncharacterized protein YcgI (DUF1989 family)
MIEQQRVPPGGGAAIRLSRGQKLRIIDLEVGRRAI